MFAVLSKLQKTKQPENETFDKLVFAVLSKLQKSKQTEAETFEEHSCLI